MDTTAVGGTASATKRRWDVPVAGTAGKLVARAPVVEPPAPGTVASISTPLQATAATLPAAGVGANATPAPPAYGMDPAAYQQYMMSVAAMGQVGAYGGGYGMMYGGGFPAGYWGGYGGVPAAGGGGWAGYAPPVPAPAPAPPAATAPMQHSYNAVPPPLSARVTVVPGSDTASRPAPSLSAAAVAAAAWRPHLPMGAYGTTATAPAPAPPPAPAPAPTAVSTAAAGSGGKAAAWPPALEAYAVRALQAVTGQPEAAVSAAKTALWELVRAKSAANALWTTDWAATPLVNAANLAELLAGPRAPPAPPAPPAAPPGAPHAKRMRGEDGLPHHGAGSGGGGGGGGESDSEGPGFILLSGGYRKVGHKDARGAEGGSGGGGGGGGSANGRS